MADEITVAELNKIVKAIEKESSFDGEVLKLGKLLEIKPVVERNYTKGCDCPEIIGYDIYRYADEELMEDDDYDFDSDFIMTIYKK